jgi:phosphate-selective porin OprO and OprP
MNVRVWLGVVAALALPTTAAVAQTSTAPTVTELLQRLEEQDKRIRTLEQRLQEAQQPATASPTPAVSAGSGAAVVSPAAGAPPVGSGTGATPAVSPGAGAAAVTQPGVSDLGPQTSNSISPAVSSRSAARQLALQSADGANIIRFRANFQVDGRWFSDKVTPGTADTFVVRKARPYIEGTLDDIYDFRLMPDFGQGKAMLVDAYVAGRFKPWLTVQAGKFKGPVGLERLQPDQYNRFLELGLPSDLVPNRDLGVQLGGDLFGGTLSYAVGYFDGVTDGNSSDANASPDVDNDGKKDAAGRLFAQPFLKSGHPYLSGLGLGVGATYVNATGSATNTLLATYKTTSTQSFFSYRTGTSATYADGKRERVAPQFFYYAGSFGLIGEYVQSKQDVSRQVSTTVKRSDRLDNSAWQVAASFFLTGERESYNNFVPKSRFTPGHAGSGWGAWELVARFQELRIDPAAFAGGAASFADPSAAPRRAIGYGIGVNWYLDEYLKWMFDYEHTRFDGGGTGGADRAAERAFLTRFALAF